jgi:hypothetical protein
MRHALLLLALALACGPPLRHDVATRNRGRMLDARKLGAEQLQIDAERDPAVRHVLAQRGEPDYVLSDGPRGGELVYVRSSLLTMIRRPAPDAPSVVGELTPLPQAVLDVLPGDLRSGTPVGEANGPTSNCWTVPTGAEACRTCCRGPEACVIDCQPASAG